MLGIYYKDTLISAYCLKCDREAHINGYLSKSDRTTDIKIKCANCSCSEEQTVPTVVLRANKHVVFYINKIYDNILEWIEWL